MALLTAEDVLNKAFSKTKYREGFDQDEVDDFLDEVAHTISSLMAERDDFAARLQAAQSGQSVAPAPAQPSPASGQTDVASSGLLGAATDPNPSPTGMLAMAQKLHDEYVTSGEAEKERIIAEAKEKAETIVQQAQGDADSRLQDLAKERTELESKIDDLRRFERDYRTRLTSYLENLLGDLDHGAGQDRQPSDAPSTPAAAATEEAPAEVSAAPATAPVSGTLPWSTQAHEVPGNESQSESSSDDEQPSDGAETPGNPWARESDSSDSPEPQQSPYGAASQPQDFASVFQDVAPANENDDASGETPVRRRSPFDPVESDAEDRPSPFGGSSAT